ncbi:MAG: hypothetical protein FWF92_06985 [Oscillospiraceae bacterium]|nr:hypothetical protein [Oscillospiraceae bacterium]
MNKKYLIESINDETLAKLIDKTLNFEKRQAAASKKINTNLLKIISAAAAVLIVIGLINILPVMLDGSIVPDNIGMQNNDFIKREINIDGYIINLELPENYDVFDIRDIKNLDESSHLENIFINWLEPYSEAFYNEYKYILLIVKDGEIVGDIELCTITENGDGNISEEAFEAYKNNPEQNFGIIYGSRLITPRLDILGRRGYYDADYKLIYKSSDFHEGAATHSPYYKKEHLEYFGMTDFSHFSDFKEKQIIAGESWLIGYNKGVLGYNLDLNKFIKIELYYDSITDEELTFIAESLRINMPQKFQNNSDFIRQNIDIIYNPESPVYTLSFELPKDMSLELTYEPGPDQGRVFDKYYASYGLWKIIKNGEYIGIINIDLSDIGYNINYSRLERLQTYKENPEQNFRAVYDSMPMGSMVNWGTDYKITYKTDDHWEGSATSLMYYRSDWAENNNITDVSRFKEEIIEGNSRIDYYNKSIAAYNLNLKEPVIASIEIYYDAVTDEELTHIAETLRIDGEDKWDSQEQADDTNADPGPAPTIYIDFNISIRPEQYNENPFYENDIRKVIKSVEELKSLCKDESYGYWETDGTGQQSMYIRELSQTYDEEYFKDNALVAVAFEYNSSSIPKNIYRAEVRDNMLTAWAYEFEDITLPENEKFTSGLYPARVFLIEVKKLDVASVTEVYPGIDGAPVVIIPEEMPTVPVPAPAAELRESLADEVYSFISFHHGYNAFMNNDELKPNVNTLYAIWKTYLLETEIGVNFDTVDSGGFFIPVETVKNAASYIYDLDGENAAYDEFYIYGENSENFWLPDGFSPNTVWAFIQWDTLTYTQGICKFDVIFYDSPTDDESDRGIELRTFNYEFEQVLYKDKIICYKFIGAERIK